jgi:hypothetical protein
MFDFATDAPAGCMSHEFTANRVWTSSWGGPGNGQLDECSGDLAVQTAISVTLRLADVPLSEIRYFAPVDVVVCTARQAFYNAGLLVASSS